MTNRMIAALSIAVALGAAPVAAQDSAGEAARRAETLDRLLGSGADLPRPDPAPPQTVTWLPAPLPPWLAAQPYRQQPLFATIPVGAAAAGRFRPGSGP